MIFDTISDAVKIPVNIAYNSVLVISSNILILYFSFQINLTD